MSALSATKKEFLYEKETEFTDFAILQLVVLIYTSSTVISKIAAQSAESGKGWTFLLLYGAEIGVLGIYALCWQQVIKRWNCLWRMRIGRWRFCGHFLGGITVRGADYGEKTHRRRTGACRDADYQRRKGAGKS